MNKLPLIIVILVSLFCAGTVQAQRDMRTARETHVCVAVIPSAASTYTVMAESPFPTESPSEQKNDPGYDAYKKGYDLILDEKWDDAVKQFKNMIAKYPESQYADDANYWIAYAYKSIDVDKARDQYKKFLKNYPKSKYYDDAISDLSELGDTVIISVSGDNQNVVVGTGVGRGNSYGYGFGSTMKSAELQLRLAQRMTMQMMNQPGIPPMAWAPRVAPFSDEHLDKETQLKLDALNALGDKKDDEETFKTLSDIAEDPKQNKTLRLAAMDQLVDYKKFNPLPVFVEIAKRDTSEDIQNMAIDYIGSISDNKDRSVETLSELFSAIPSYRILQLQIVLNSIADIGNDKAVDFLGNVARTDDNYDLRRSAINCLSSIGNDRAHGVLLKLLKADAHEK